MPDVIAATSSPIAAQRYAANPAQVALCRNCGEVLTGPFCAACGQHGAVGRLTLRALAGEFFAQVAQLDHGLLFTFVALLRRPGPTIREYIEGRRRAYTSPITFMVLSVGFAVLHNELTSKATAFGDQFAASVDQLSASSTPAQRAALHHITEFLNDHRTVFMVAALVPIALVLRLLFRKQRLNLAEIGTFACYTVATTTLLKLLLFLPLDLTHSMGGMRRFVSFALLAYVAYASLDFFGRSIWTLGKLVVAVGTGLTALLTCLLLLPKIIA